MSSRNPHEERRFVQYILFITNKLIVGPAVVKQLLDELEKSVKELEDKYREKVQVKGVRITIGSTYHIK